MLFRSNKIEFNCDIIAEALKHVYETALNADSKHHTLAIYTMMNAICIIFVTDIIIQSGEDSNSLDLQKIGTLEVTPPLD